jgi:hypothetical protein
MGDRRDTREKSVGVRIARRYVVEHLLGGRVGALLEVAVAGVGAGEVRDEALGGRLWAMWKRSWRIIAQSGCSRSRRLNR